MSDNKTEKDYGIISISPDVIGDAFGFNDSDTDMFNDGADKGDEDDDKSSLNDNDNKPDVDDTGFFSPDDDHSGRGKQSDGAATNTSVPTGVYHNILKKQFGEGITVVQEKDGEQVEVPIEDIDLDEETFTTIALQLKEKEREELLADTVSVKGVSELAKKVLEIEKTGGDISAILQNQARYIEPLDKLDLETTEGQKGAIALLISGTGGTEEDIEAKILYYEQKGILDVEGKKAEAEIRDRMAKFVEKQATDAVERAEKIKEEMKKYKRDFKENLSKTFQLKPTEVDKIVDFATKATEGGNFAFDANLNEARRDPEKAAKLAMFLYNTEEYEKQLVNKALEERSKQTLIQIGSAKGKEQKIDPSKNDSSASDKYGTIPIGD